MLKKLYGVIIFILKWNCVYGGGGLSVCCLNTSTAICQRNCKLLKLNHDGKFTRPKRRQRYFYLSRRLTDIVATCPRSEDRFWKCLPRTKIWRDFLEESKRRQQRQRRQSHGSCCKDAKHMSCEIQCLTSRNVTKLLNENCNKIREPKLSQCVSRIHASRRCCQSASNSRCKEACIRYFKTSQYNSVLDGKSDVERKCGKASRQYQCVMKQSNYQNVIQDFTKCCSVETSKKCEDACKQGLEKLHDFSALFGTLGKVCGKFNTVVPMYKCLLKTSMDLGKREPEVPLNEPRDRTVLNEKGPGNFKEQCCYRAKSNACQNWCSSKTASPSLMGLWDTMYLSCIQDPREVELSNCMSDILEPCQIGVKAEMQFCSNFNNRPLELFRRCDVHGDNEARELHSFWANGLVHVLEYNFLFKDVNTCRPEMFKAMACLISIKPCDHLSSRRQVCRSDCEELLDACLVKDRQDIPVSAAQVCAAMLPKDNQTGCISVRDYLNKPNQVVEKRGEGKEFTQPCDGNPCGSNRICTINRKCSGGRTSAGRSCTPYTCSRGCLVSHQSNLMIPVGQLAKLRVDNRRECYHVCKCMQHTSKRMNVTYFGQCIEFGCKKKRNCTLKKKIFNDAEVFRDGCNTCTCHDGESLCTKNYCGYDLSTFLTGRPRRHYSLAVGPTSLCNCGDLYNPVCGENGMTYPNPCVARCCRMKDSQLNVGDCHSVDPCNPYPCSHKRRCIPKRTVCLSSGSHCPQFICVKRQVRHGSLTCPTQGEEKMSDFVCGYDGVTYRSRCLAFASGTGIDYDGPCLTKQENLGKVRCKDIVCPVIDEGDCQLFQPPGACCPVCGSMLRILYSHRDLDRHHQYINNDPITVLDVVKQMRQLQRVAQCSLYGHRTVEGDLVILIVVNTKAPTRRQVHACVTEAERINKYINYGSPVVTPLYHLSILKVSRLKKAKWKHDGGTSASTPLFISLYNHSMLILCTLIVALLSNWR